MEAARVDLSFEGRQAFVARLAERKKVLSVVASTPANCCFIFYVRNTAKHAEPCATSVEQSTETAGGSVRANMFDPNQ